MKFSVFILVALLATLSVIKADIVDAEPVEPTVPAATGIVDPVLEAPNPEELLTSPASPAPVEVVPPAESPAPSPEPAPAPEPSPEPAKPPAPKASPAIESGPDPEQSNKKPAESPASSPAASPQPAPIQAPAPVVKNPETSPASSPAPAPVVPENTKTETTDEFVYVNGDSPVPVPDNTDPGYGEFEPEGENTEPGYEHTEPESGYEGGSEKVEDSSDDKPAYGGEPVPESFDDATPTVEVEDFSEEDEDCDEWEDVYETVTPEAPEVLAVETDIDEAAETIDVNAAESPVTYDGAPAPETAPEEVPPAEDNVYAGKDSQYLATESTESSGNGTTIVAIGVVAGCAVLAVAGTLVYKSVKAKKRSSAGFA